MPRTVSLVSTRKGKKFRVVPFQSICSQAGHPPNSSTSCCSLVSCLQTRCPRYLPAPWLLLRVADVQKKSFCLRLAQFVVPVTGAGVLLRTARLKQSWSMECSIASGPCGHNATVGCQRSILTSLLLPSPDPHTPDTPALPASLEAQTPLPTLPAKTWGWCVLRFSTAPVRSGANEARDNELPVALSNTIIEPGANQGSLAAPHPLQLTGFLSLLA